MKEVNEVKGQRVIIISLCCITAFTDAVLGQQTIQGTIFDFYSGTSLLVVILCVISLWKMKLYALFYTYQFLLLTK